MHGWTPVLCLAGMVAGGALSAAGRLPPAIRTSSLSLAHEAFYNARYEEAAAHAFESLASAPDDLAAYELRTTALLFQVKRLLGDDKKPNHDPQKPNHPRPACERCPDLIAAFLSDISAAQGLARDRLRAEPADETVLYFLGKIDLNYVWLHLGPLGRKAGWSEYLGGQTIPRQRASSQSGPCSRASSPRVG